MKKYENPTAIERTLIKSVHVVFSKDLDPLEMQRFSGPLAPHEEI